MTDDHNDLPEFRTPPRAYVENYMQTVLGNSFVKLQHRPDGAFRAVFDFSYFHIKEGETRPSKSQWGTLKKRMKRLNKGVFVFKETGEIDIDGEAYAVIAFGFFAD